MRGNAVSRMPGELTVTCRAHALSWLLWLRAVPTATTSEPASTAREHLKRNATTGRAQPITRTQQQPVGSQ